MTTPPYGNQSCSRVVLGVDEAGRGPLAGPVVAAGVVLDTQKDLIGLRDSKRLSPAMRESLYHMILDKALFVSVHEIDAATIDRINILQATLQAMADVVDDCLRSSIGISQVLIDGSHTIPKEFSVQQRAIIKGDSTEPSIMAASIIAKVHRDRLMERYDQEYPNYGFSAHKGYGTKAHMEAIRRVGPCAIHRKSFRPVRDVLTC